MRPAAVLAAVLLLAAGAVPAAPPASAPLAAPPASAPLAAPTSVQPAGALGRRHPPGHAPGLVDTLVGIIDYTRWPGAARALLLCIATDAPSAGRLAAALAAPQRARPLATRVVAAQAPLPEECDIVFVDEPVSEPTALRAWLASLASRPVLTLGQGADFCDAGGMFCLKLQAGELRFAVNHRAVAVSGLQVNARLLQLGLRHRGR